MGCGESKHAVATTEPIKRSTSSRSSSKRIENPEQEKTTTTKTSNTIENEKAAIVDGNEKNDEKPIGVIPGEPFVIQKPPLATPKKGVINKSVAHDRTVSKGSQTSDYFSEDGIEDRSEYESPQLDADKGGNEAVANVVLIEKVKTKEERNGEKENVIVVEEYTKTESGNAITTIQGKEEKVETQDEHEQTQVTTQEELAKQDFQETEPIQVEDGTTITAEAEGEAKSANNTVVIAEQQAMEAKPTIAEAEITAESENKTVVTDVIKPTELQVRTITEEKIENADA